MIFLSTCTVVEAHIVKEVNVTEPHRCVMSTSKLPGALTPGQGDSTPQPRLLKHGRRASYTVSVCSDLFRATVVSLHCNFTSQDGYDWTGVAQSFRGELSCAAHERPNDDSPDFSKPRAAAFCG